jgi:hypothetical protein
MDMAKNSLQQAIVCVLVPSLGNIIHDKIGLG